MGIGMGQLLAKIMKSGHLRQTNQNMVGAIIAQRIVVNLKSTEAVRELTHTGLLPQFMATTEHVRPHAAHCKQLLKKRESTKTGLH